MKQSITCRQCKENPSTWEIEDQNGQVQQKHYKTKQECVKAANQMCEEYGLDLIVEDKYNK